jgi:hypothetical protein
VRWWKEGKATLCGVFIGGMRGTSWLIGVLSSAYQGVICSVVVGFNSEHGYVYISVGSHVFSSTVHIHFTSTRFIKTRNTFTTTSIIYVVDKARSHHQCMHAQVTPTQKPPGVSKTKQKPVPRTPNPSHSAAKIGDNEGIEAKPREREQVFLFACEYKTPLSRVGEDIKKRKLLGSLRAALQLNQYGNKK